MFEHIKTDSLDNIALACAQFNHALTSNDPQIQQVKKALPALQIAIPMLGKIMQAKGAGDMLSKTIANLEYVVYGLDIQTSNEQDAKILVEILNQVGEILRLIISQPDQYLPSFVSALFATDKVQEAFTKNLKRIELMGKVLSARIKLTSLLKSDLVITLDNCAGLCDLIVSQEDSYKKESCRDKDTVPFLVHVNQIHVLIVKPLIEQLIKNHYPEEHLLAHNAQTYIETINRTHKYLLAIAKNYATNKEYQITVEIISAYEKWFTSLSLPLDNKQHILMPDLSNRSSVTKPVELAQVNAAGEQSVEKVEESTSLDDDIIIDDTKFFAYESDDESSDEPINIRLEKDELIDAWNAELAELMAQDPQDHEHTENVVLVITSNAPALPIPQQSKIKPRENNNSGFGSFANLDNIYRSNRIKKELDDDILNLIQKSSHHESSAVMENNLTVVHIEEKDDDIAPLVIMPIDTTEELNVPKRQKRVFPTAVKKPLVEQTSGGGSFLDPLAIQGAKKQNSSPLDDQTLAIINANAPQEEDPIHSLQTLLAQPSDNETQITPNETDLSTKTLVPTITPPTKTKTYRIGPLPEYPPFTAKQIALSVLYIGVAGLVIGAAASTGIGAFFALGSLAALFTTTPGIAMLTVVAAPVLTYFGVKYKRGEKLIEGPSSLPKLTHDSK